MLDNHNPLPLHIQLKEILLKEIRQEVYEEKIPSERELMDKYSVSRTTVREAVTALVHEGVLEKIHGKGTFINRSHSVNEWLGYLSSFTETIERMGMESGAHLLYQGTGSRMEIAETLGVEEYYCIKRLRFADNEPIAIERHYYPLEIGFILKKYDLNQITLYEKLELEGIVLQDAEQRISAENPSANDAKLLRISENTCTLVAQRLITDPLGKPIEYYHSIYQADKYVFSLKMSRGVRVV
ncbi:transcriptional regulator, GntR family [Desulforamulus reducens MI-1]|uniref:Transcriptional regulator, GntR family n=1 Tax=Desulforamulus reducens (strain ATCC BAA-1160 / DSM 100696 / MI-1) TaxID=349161 RepID=A4J859_DESRM|nr:GntR family transcriptional regulator [Desulforamulus reducens]ABO51262.1 transcriptional regulator, GntR family [Desulforamulus reducens MI-1]